MLDHDVMRQEAFDKELDGLASIKDLYLIKNVTMKIGYFCNCVVRARDLEFKCCVCQKKNSL